MSEWKGITHEKDVLCLPDGGDKRVGGRRVMDLFEPMSYSLSYTFPPVSGKDQATYPDHPEWKLEPVQISQIGFYVYGKFLDPESNETYDLIGR